MQPPFNPSADQLAIINSAESVCILAGPGTGKSVTALATARQASGKIPKSQNVLFISLSNSAISRLSKSAGIECEGINNLRFLTYHSLAWDIIRAYGRHIGLSEKVQVMDEVERGILELEGYAVEEKSTIDDLMKVARKTGKISFKLMVPLAIEILKKIPQLRTIESKRFPLIIADEFQDTRDDQWELLKLVGEKSRVIILGDLNQNIYHDAFEASQQRVNEFLKWKNAKLLKFSHKSFRSNNSEILDLSECMISGKKFVVSNNQKISIKACYSTQFRYLVAAHCLDILKKFPSKKIGILTPSGPSAHKLAIELKLPPSKGAVSQPIHTRIPISENSKDAFRCACVALFQYKKRKDDVSLKMAAQALIAMRIAFSSRVSRGTSDIAEIIGHLSQPPKTKRSKKPLYDLVNLKVDLSIQDFEKLFIERLGEHDKFGVVAEQIKLLGYSMIDPTVSVSSQMDLPFDYYRGNREPKGLHGEINFQSKVEVLSIWKSKGREFDFVIVVMDPRMMKDLGEETEKRLLYVAFTRAKDWLGVLYPSNRPGRALYRTLQKAI